MARRRIRPGGGFGGGGGGDSGEQDGETESTSEEDDQAGRDDDPLRRVGSPSPAPGVNPEDGDTSDGSSSDGGSGGTDTGSSTESDDQTGRDDDPFRRPGTGGGSGGPLSGEPTNDSGDGGGSGGPDGAQGDDGSDNSGTGNNGDGLDYSDRVPDENEMEGAGGDRGTSEQRSGNISNDEPPRRETVTVDASSESRARYLAGEQLKDQGIIDSVGELNVEETGSGFRVEYPSAEARAADQLDDQFSDVDVGPGDVQQTENGSFTVDETVPRLQAAQEFDDQFAGVDVAYSDIESTGDGGFTLDQQTQAAVAEQQAADELGVAEGDVEFEDGGIEFESKEARQSALEDQFGADADIERVGDGAYRVTTTTPQAERGDELAQPVDGAGSQTVLVPFGEEGQQTVQDIQDAVDEQQAELEQQEQAREDILSGNLGDTNEILEDIAESQADGNNVGNDTVPGQGQVDMEPPGTYGAEEVEVSTQPPQQSTASPDFDVQIGSGSGQGPLDTVLSASQDATELVTQGVVQPTAVGAGALADLGTDVVSIPTDVVTGRGVQVNTEGSGVVEDFTEDTVQGAGQVLTSLTVGAPLTAQAVGETAVDAGEFAVENPTEVPGATADVAADYVSETIDTAQHRPGLLAGQFLAGAGVGSVAARGVAGTRLMTGRTGRAIEVASKYDPGANAVRLGKRGLSGVRSRVGSSGTGSGVALGRTPPGTGGTGQLLDADAVDAARGVSGPSRRARVRGRIERSEVAAQIRSFRDNVQTFLDDTRAQQQLIGRSDGQGQRGGSSSQTDVDLDEDVPTDYEPSRDDILEDSPRDQISDDITERVQADLDESRGDFEGTEPAFRDTDTATQPGNTDVESYENLYGSPAQRELSEIQGDLRDMAQREGGAGRAEPRVDDPVGVADDSAVFPRERAVAGTDVDVEAAQAMRAASADAEAGTTVSTAVVSGGLAALQEAQQFEVTDSATTPDRGVVQAATPRLDVDTRTALATLPFAEDLGADAAARADEVMQVDTDAASDVSVDAVSGVDADVDVGTDTGVDVTVATDTDVRTGGETGSATDSTTATDTPSGRTTPTTDRPATPGDTDAPPDRRGPPQDPGTPRVPLDPDTPSSLPPRGPTDRDPPRVPRPRPDLPDDNDVEYASQVSVDLDTDEKTFKYAVASPSEVADGVDLDDPGASDADDSGTIDLDLNLDDL